MSLLGDAEAVATGGPVALALKHWKLIVGGLALSILGVMLFFAKADVRHWKAQDALHLSQRDVEIQKNAINLASIGRLEGIIKADNAEKDARAKAFADAKVEDARTIAEMDRRYRGTAGRVASLEAIARVPGGNAACRVPGAVSSALEGL